MVLIKAEPMWGVMQEYGVMGFYIERDLMVGRGRKAILPYWYGGEKLVRKV